MKVHTNKVFSFGKSGGDLNPYVSIIGQGHWR